MDTGGQLWDAFKSGDMDAFGELYHRHYRSLYNYGFTIYADKELLMDCLHELFLDLWERRARLPMVGNARYYLLVAFRRRLMYAIRQHRLREAGIQREATIREEVAAHVQPSAEDDLLETETRFIFNSRFRKAFDKLPPRRREAIYLRYHQQLSYNQIMVAMEIQYQTVRDLVSKGLKTLRQELLQGPDTIAADDSSWDITRWST